MNPSLPPAVSSQDLSQNLESSTIQKQRQELQLLIAELKDRDKELNDMVVVHQRQLLAWEDDRQKILTLAERCSLLENELLKRNEMIRTLTKRLKLLESQQNDRRTTLESTQQKLKELSQKAADTTLHCQVLEDKDILEAGNYIAEFTSKFKKLENALRAAKAKESSINKEKQDFKLSLKELMLEMSKLKEDLSEKTKENNEQREEVIRLKQENGYLKNELMLSVEKANRKDQLLQFAKSKQVRTDTELSSLRQIYVKQQHDLQFLHFNLESSQELRQKHEKEACETSRPLSADLESNCEEDTVRSEGLTQKMPKEYRTTEAQKCRLRTICNVCLPEKVVDVSAIEESTSARLHRLQKGLLERQKALFVEKEEEEKQDASSRSDEPESRTLSSTDSTRPGRSKDTFHTSQDDSFFRGNQQTFEASLPIHEHWLSFSSCLVSSSALTQHASKPDKTDFECKGQKDTAGISCGSKSSESLSTVDMFESGCYHTNSDVDKATWCEPVTDLEWIQIFKPIKDDGNVWHKSVCNSPKIVPEIQSTSLKRDCTSGDSEENVDMNAFYLDSPCCLTSTQKGDGPQRCEKFFDADLPLDISNLSVIQPTNRCYSPTASQASNTLHQDSCSPTSRLQRLLAESRQMVADLELSRLLHDSPGCTPNSSCVNTAIEITEALRKAQLPAAEESKSKLSLFSL
ncbi:coiled-coil domain-containing protein 62 isoform X2 [Alligator sinensis]|uniref:Coiled-coil domain-containing protein 62 isoform X2 n=1 Tax=Alligator sinensis TaxID=38654 RepID=A0A3Q0G6Y2_ALLSI|nr:coiled-coil domain-containing protein 62 isoform X2 [Alligator sinensis]